MGEWESLTWLEKGVIFILAAITLYAAWNVFALLWRIPELISAKKELAEAQKRYYEAKTEEIVKRNNPPVPRDPA